MTTERTPLLLTEDEAWTLIGELLRLSAWLVHRVERGRGFAMTELDSPGQLAKDWRRGLLGSLIRHASDPIGKQSFPEINLLGDMLQRSIEVLDRVGLETEPPLPLEDLADHAAIGQSALDKMESQVV